MAKEVKEKVVYEPADCLLVKVSGNVNVDDDAFTHTGNDVYHVMSLDKSEDYGECKIKADPGSNKKMAIFMPASPCNRKLILLSVANKHFAENDEMILEYKASKHIEGGSTHTYELYKPLKKDAKLVEYLDDAQKAEYQVIINKAIEVYNAQKAKPMTELEKAQAALAKAQRQIAILNGEEVPEEVKEKTERKSIIDCVAEEDYDRYNELLDIAADAKSKAPKVKREGKPMSKETKLKMAEARKKKLEEQIAKLLAAQLDEGNVAEEDIAEATE